MIWRSDASGACNYFNENWLRFRGTTLADDCGEGWLKGIHPDDAELCVTCRRTNFQNRAEFRIKYRLCRHDGVWRPVQDAGVPYYAQDGSFAGFVGCCVEAANGRDRRWRELSGVLSLCSWCHRVQDEEGSWEMLERYVTRRGSMTFTHGICPECLQRQTAET